MRPSVHCQDSERRDALGLATDLTSQTAVGRSMTAVSERWWSLNILVNAVGPVEVGIGRFEDIDDIEWQATFDIGVLSAVRTVRAALPLLRSCDLGPCGQPFGALDQAPINRTRCLHCCKVRAHERDEEPLRPVGQRSNSRQYRVAWVFPYPKA